MFSGKTEALLEAIARAEKRGRTVLALKPAFDSNSPNEIRSHAGDGHQAHVFESLPELLAVEPELVVLDEVQFLTAEAANVLRALVDNGSDVVVAGLDFDFRTQRFEVVGRLAALADRVVQLTAVCTRCGQRATLTQRVANGRPVALRGPRLLVGGEELYQPRCAKCYWAERSPSPPDR